MNRERESFIELIARVRQGDEQAAEELILRYEQDLRVIARVRLTDTRMRRVMDSMDICQSIMANFFLRAAAGQFELETPEQLTKLLATMVRNKVTDLARHAHRDCRDIRRITSDHIETYAVAGSVGTPSQIVARSELLEALLSQLGDEEQVIARQRADGHCWSDIANELGRSPDAVRKGYARAVSRALCVLGVDGATDE